MKTNLTSRIVVRSGAGLAVIIAACALLLVLWADGSSVQTTQIAHAQQQSSSDPGGLQSVRVKVIYPALESLRRSSTLAASVQPFEEADLFAKTSGYLENVRVDIGDQVQKGDVLAEIWVPEVEQEHVHQEALVELARAEQAQAEAAIKAAESLLEAAKAKVSEARSQIARFDAEASFRQIELDRHQQLFNDRALQRNVVDEKEKQMLAAQAASDAARAALDTAEANLLVEQARLNQAHADLASAVARVKVAQAKRDQASVLLGYAKITAPHDGVVTERLVHPGAFIQSAVSGKADPLFHLVRVDRVRIVADLPETDSSWIKVGQPATLQVDALRNQILHGKVARFANALDGDTRTMRVEVELDAPKAVLRPGMYGSLTITLADEEGALLVPANVLVTGHDGPGVMVAHNGRAERRQIEIGQNDGIRVQVVRGLSDRDQIIAEGKDAVRDGQPVEVITR